MYNFLLRDTAFCKAVSILYSKCSLYVQYSKIKKKKKQDNVLCSKKTEKFFFSLGNKNENGAVNHFVVLCSVFTYDFCNNIANETMLLIVLNCDNVDDMMAM